MYKFCVFAGTTEGRELVEFLTGQAHVSVTACVATEYGETLLSPAENLTVRTKRLTAGEMAELLAEHRFDLVIDATHPYAAAATENVARACAETGTEYLRLLREGSAVSADAAFVPDVPAAVENLNSHDGNILLTTGSKELHQYTGIINFAERVYARVLPSEEALAACAAAGLPPSHVIAMQGPFSAELNAALLRAVGAKYLVTKDGGGAGGFPEKADAANQAGAKLVVLGRPPQRGGLGFSETLAFLCSRFGFRRAPRVTVLGVGPGSPGAMTGEARRAIDRADCLIGARRMLAHARPGQPSFEAVAPDAIAELILSHPEYRRFAVALSGDTGLFSGAKKLLPRLAGCAVEVLPGLSSLAYLCARLRTSYEDVVSVSLHGREHNIVPDVRASARVFALTGGENGAGALCKRLAEAGLGHVRVHVGERLSYPDERIASGTAAELAEGTYDSLSAVLIENDAPDAVVTPGLPDAAFQRGEAVPMTKSEVRAVCLSKLRLTERAVCWDVGAGTGSVAIEMALQAKKGSVYAVERGEAALGLLETNRARFSAGNLTVVPGAAPEACERLPAPTHVFLGGSGGETREILTLALEKNPAARVVATAVTLETAAELTACMKELGFTETEVVSLSVARDRKAGPYHLMTGQNPVYIFTMQTKEDAK